MRRETNQVTLRLLSLILALVLTLSLVPVTAFRANAAAGDTLYFVPGDQWGSDNAWYAAYFFGAGEKWVAMADSDGDGHFECTIPFGGYTHVIFCRMNAASKSLSWDNKWNQTDNLALTAGKNCFTMSNSTQWNEKASGTWSKYTPAGGETPTTPSTPSDPTAKRDVVVHFRNTNCWSNVKFYAWDADTQEQLLGTWPGTAAPAESGTVNWYTLKLEGVTAASVGIVFNDGNGNQLDDVVLTNIPAAGGEYWYDGAVYTAAPSTYPNGEVKTVSCDVTLHFANTKDWGNVCAYGWAGSSYVLGAWPGTKMGMDSSGFYTISFTAKVPEGQSFGYIINNGGSGAQTVDLSLSAAQIASGKVELWLQTGSEYVDEDPGSVKYNCDTFTNPNYIALSPDVNGTTVTLRYRGSYGDTVKIYGSMNGWKTAYTMTADSYGVYSYTFEDLRPGTYEYKFVVNSNWITDPNNGWVSADGNSVFQVLDPNAVDNNTVTIKLHYARPDGNYSGWNLWVWGLSTEAKQYDLQYVAGEYIATVVVDGRATQYISYIPRHSVGDNKWESQEYGERRVMLTDIVSGTVHCYITSGSYDTLRSLETDVVKENKVNAVELDYDTGKITVSTTKMVSVDPMQAFRVTDVTGKDTSVAIESVEERGSTYILTLNKSINLENLYRYKINFLDQKEFKEYNYGVCINTVYASDRFAEEFTYNGTDLGATWSKNSTFFRVWAPSAEGVSVNLYTSGTDGTDDLIKAVPMTKSVDGTWIATVSGNLNGVYYTYAVNRDGKIVEATDPYARTTGVNGIRAMVIDLDSTNPAGWDKDTNPNSSKNYTDAVIYELHVRDFSIDDSSGITNKGKYLGLTEHGTKTPAGNTTGLDYLKELGITHLHLLPVYDFAATSVDETDLDTPQFNWGYDPQNYNVPEGSYSSDPYKGEVRVTEFKQMVKTLHDNGISVVMDVVYNHVSDAGKFSMNMIVPGYFSRQNADGSYSNGSGCGNDTASEREMVRKYIVESIMYWKEEYHIDGFRFDLVGLLDATTINQIVDTVHAKYPDVIFYGEGWTMGTAVEPGNTMATQANSGATPNFAYFSDTIRNLLGGENGKTTGFAAGAGYTEGAVADNFLAKPWWTNRPTQIIQYASCHDNYTLADKLILSTGRSGVDSTIIKMNKLTAAVYMTSQGVPFIHAGEEFLREKIREDGSRCENSYNSSDYVNHIEWSNLDKSSYMATSEYYKGLIKFRQNHAALRLTSNADILNNVTCRMAEGGLVVFQINGGINGEISDGIVVIFNNNSGSKTVSLPSGSWKICVNDTKAGTDVLGTASGSVTVAGISAMILVKGQTAISHTYGDWSSNETHHWKDCTCCENGKDRISEAAHTLVNGTCSVCGWTESVDVPEDPSVVPTLAGTGFTLSFEDEILVNFYYTAENTEDVVSNGMVVFYSDPGTADMAKADVIYDNANYVEASGSYIVTTNGIAAKEMGDNRYYAAYAELKDGTYAYSPLYQYSPKKYAMSRIKNSTNANMKALCVAMLNYGAAAQEFFGYRTEDLMNSELTAEQKALAKPYTSDLLVGAVAADPSKTGNFAQTAAGFSGRSASVSFEGAFMINYYFAPSQSVDGDLTFYYWSAEDYAAASKLTTANATGSMVMKAQSSDAYSAQVTGIAAKQIDDTFYVCGVYTSGGNTYCTGIIAYSLSRYCKNNASSADTGMQNLAKATAVYGYHAATYFAN